MPVVVVNKRAAGPWSRRCSALDRPLGPIEIELDGRCTRQDEMELDDHGRPAHAMSRTSSDEAVADTPHVYDEPRRARCIELSAQTTGVGVNGTRTGADTLVPDRAKQFLL